MQLISFNQIKNNMLKLVSNNKKNKHYMNDFFNTFFDKNKDEEYFWINKKVYITESTLHKIIKYYYKISGKKFSDFKTKEFNKHQDNIIPLSYVEIKSLILQETVARDTLLQLENEKLLDFFYKSCISVGTKNYKLISFDLEFWEQDINKILEIGWSIYHEQKISSYHFIVEEHLNLMNNKYAISNKFSRDDYKIQPLDSILLEFKKIIETDNIVLCAHGCNNDLIVLKKLGIVIDKESVIDTAYIGAAIQSSNEPVNLAKLLKDFNIREGGTAHNAGDDAENTIKLFLKMGEELNEIRKQ